jgi:hypothetical protein
MPFESSFGAPTMRVAPSRLTAMVPEEETATTLLTPYFRAASQILRMPST